MARRPVADLMRAEKEMARFFRGGPWGRTAFAWPHRSQLVDLPGIDKADLEIDLNTKRFGLS